jgi:Serine dehydratase beta chain
MGIGPSSSRTVGPIHAAAEFVWSLARRELLLRTRRVRVDFYGSLAFTGRGHGRRRRAQGLARSSDQDDVRNRPRYAVSLQRDLSRRRRRERDRVLKALTVTDTTEGGHKKPKRIAAESVRAIVLATSLV